MRKLTLVLIAASALIACRAPRATSAQTVSAANIPPPSLTEAGSLGPGDIVEVRVYEEADLSGPYRLSQEGNIDFPLCGRVKAEGLTPTKLNDALTLCLGKGYLKHPNLTVLVREYNSKKVFVLGEVQKPGTFPYEENMSIVQAVTLAGGFTKTASQNSTSVTRTIGGKEVKIHIPVEDIGLGKEKNFLMQPGDIVFVPESFF